MITKGDLIASAKPFAFVLCSEERNKRCDQCFKLLTSKIPCYKCFNVIFCSPKCQYESEQEHNHSHECPVLMTRPIRDMTRIIARVIQKIGSNDMNQAEQIGTYRRDWNCLMDHYDNIVKDANVMYAFDGILTDLELIFGDLLPQIRTVLSIYGKILINSFAVQDEFMRQIGKAVYLGPSIFDHSCTPTASFTFIGTTIFIKSTKTLPTNDVKEVRISYIDEFETRHERQKQLQSSYYFECDCERCKAHLQQISSINGNEDERLRSIHDTLYKLSDEEHFLIFENTINKNRLQDSKTQNQNNSITEMISQMRKEVNCLQTILEVRIADIIAIRDKDIDQSLKIIDIYRSYYGSNHLRLALRLYIAAKFANKSHILKKQLLNEARSVAYLLTPNLKEVENQIIYSNDRSRARIKNYDKRLLSNSLLNSTLLHRIEEELNATHLMAYHRINNRNVFKYSNGYKHRSRSADYRYFGFNQNYLHKHQIL